jgi:magnesium chelatase family protein
VEVDAVPISALSGHEAASESSAGVRARVATARARQAARQGGLNARLASRALARSCRLGPSGRALLDACAERLHLSARAYHRVLRVSRTIADLAGAAGIDDDHLSEALQYRFVD